MTPRVERVTRWRSMKDAPRDRTILGRIGEMRFLCEWAQSEGVSVFGIKLSTAPGEWAYDLDENVVPADPEEWREVP